jgi:flavin reductase (DIM6/NTAB) family NADH-FMN oxidoreductase RutF
VSTRAGDRLDEACFRRLSGELASRPPDAILIATTDDRGRPHPALLSYGEVLAVTPAVLRFALSANSTTAHNLAARGAVTLCLIGPEGAAYVKAAARALPAERSLAEKGLVAFEARVEDVLVDAPAARETAHLTSGITFAPDDPVGQAREWATRLDALRRA